MKIPLLVTLDENYIPQLRTLMTSLYFSHPGHGFDLYLLHSHISEKALTTLASEMTRFQYRLFPIRADEEIFAGAKITDRYPQEMYYRLLAAKLLPQDLDKILYLDPDILVINALDELWNTNIDEYLFAAASHSGITDATNNVNRLRLGTDSNYFNSGVLLCNLKKCREEIQPEEIYAFIEEKPYELILPDQDVLNALYGSRILEVPDILWNYDARKYPSYLIRSLGEADLKWVMDHTAILHFCGRDKPWLDSYTGRFCALYQHYMRLTERYLGEWRGSKTEA